MARRRLLRHGGAKSGVDANAVRNLDALRLSTNSSPAAIPDTAAREQAIRQLAADWARNWDANSLVILRRATIGFDTVKDFAKIRAKVLYVLCRSDALFPPKT